MNSRRPGSGTPSEPASNACVSVVQRGRGAVSQPAGRFEQLDRAPIDDGWYRDDSELPPLRTEVSNEHARRILSRNQSPDVPFDRAINPYRGCEHGCIYCFARPTHAYLGLSPGLDFETRLRAKVNAAERLRAELSAPGYRCAPINIGAATDAYQPIEREYRITRQVLEELAACSHPLTIVTKSALVERDIDLLAPMARKRLAAVYVTITTLDARLARAWEPRAAAPWRRLRTIRRLSDAGIPVGVSVAPLAPFLNEPELEAILGQAADAGATSAFYTILRLPWELREVFGDWLASAYPDRARRVMNRLREMRGEAPDGPRVNDPRFFSRMKGQGAWAELLRLRFQLAVRRLGLNRERVDLRSDLFVPPARGPVPAAGDSRRPARECEVPAQGSLFQTL
ncbi:MAG: PA0069 family radical SAM protein [Limnobacter sp.]|nr:PA0069 family radical SAM protein [Limnobacter sp.]